MREIEFRGKRVDNGKWVYGCFLKEERPIQNGFFILNSKVNFRVHNTTVGQFTGLTDKNGTKIFEGDYNEIGDVVDWCENRNGWSLKVYDSKSNEFVMCHCFYCEGHFDIDEDLNKFEVVGNIHENKEG